MNTGGTTPAKAVILLCVGVASLAIGSVAFGNATTQAGKALVVKLKEKHRSAVSGTVTLTSMGRGMRVALRLNKRVRGSLPAHIHTGPCRREPTFANPRIYISLMNVVNGKSVTIVTRTKLTTLRAGRFSINVHAPDYSIIACGDIPRAS